jgi:hypothetical protein
LEDDCIFVPWEIYNNWCPKDTENCNNNCDCDWDKKCNMTNNQFCSIIGVCIPKWSDWENPKNPPKDTDWDWIPDLEDDCVFVFWSKQNDGCPDLAESCDENCKCSTPWYKCNIKDKDTCSKNWICIPKNRCNVDCTCNPGYRCSISPWAWASCDMAGICVKANSCLDNLTNWVWIFWNAICNTCPCDINVESSSTIQICDIIFPAILSPDWKEIYSKWKNFIIK